MSPSIISGPGKKCGPDMLWLMCQNIRKVGTSPRIAGAANTSSVEMGVRPGQASEELILKCRNMRLFKRLVS